MSNNKFYSKRIRLHLIGGLILFFILIGCAEKNKDRNVIIQWKDNHAAAILIPQQLFPGLIKDSVNSQIQVQLANSNVAMIGEFKLIADVVTFTPALSFSRGLQYHIRFKNKLVSKFEIPEDTFANAPTVTAIYPTNDTVPENLLKMYIRFSKAMQEGEAVKNILVLKNEQDTIPSIFLDLENELWNTDRTMLTLWLDPGRIKRDLQPNKKLGTPLHKATRYSLLIKKDWRSAEGISLADSYRKDFFASSPDIISPDPMNWTIQIPTTATNQPLSIYLHENLDYVLLKNTLRVTDSEGKTVTGNFETDKEEAVLNFIPTQFWKPGKYSIEIESRLEDLAGNNLNRLFDNDITRQTTIVQRGIYSRSFTIQ